MFAFLASERRVRGRQLLPEPAILAALGPRRPEKISQRFQYISI
jgi:hypothetical protein